MQTSQQLGHGTVEGLESNKLYPPYMLFESLWGSTCWYSKGLPGTMAWANISGHWIESGPQIGAVTRIHSGPRKGDPVTHEGRSNSRKVR